MAEHGALDLQLAGQTITLLPQRAVYWHARRTLILADPHIGKDDTFRRAGIPVPAAVAEHDFDRLTTLIQRHQPQRLVILGDLLHARPDHNDHAMRLLRDWRATCPEIDVLLVRGNHDKHAGNPPPELGFTIVDEPYRDGPFEYRHFPVTDRDRGIAASRHDVGAASPTREQHERPASRSDAAIEASDEESQEPHILAGHLHPGVTVRLDRLQARRVPCFHITAHQSILPAFGRFTGTARVHPAAPGELYAVGGDRVIKLPRTVLA